MTLWKSIIRHMKEKKFQYIGVTLLLVISIMLYVSLSMAISTLDNRNQEFKQTYNQEDFHFIVASSIEDGQLKDWEERFNLTLEKRMYTDVTYQEDTTLRLFSKSDSVNTPYISEGEMPSGDNEVAISSVFAKEHNLSVGEKINVNSQTITVTGFVYLPDYIYILERESDLINDPNSFGIGIGSQDVIQSLSSKTITQILGANGTKENISSLKEAVTSNFSLLKWLNAKDNPRIEFVESEIQGARATVTTLPLFILALSVMMVLMIMKRQIEMQRKEIGTLMALGYRKGELRRHYMMHAGFIGVVGSITSIVIGTALSIPITNLYSEYYNLPRISYFDWDTSVLLVGFIVPNVILLLMTYLVIRKPLTQSPLALLSPKDMSTGKKSWLENLPFFHKGTFMSRFRLRLLIRSKARALYILLGIMLSTILLIFGFISYNAMGSLIDTTYKEIYQYDYAVYYNTLQQDEVEEGSSTFTAGEINVKNVNGANRKAVDQKATIYGIKPETDQVQLLNDEEKVVNLKAKQGFIISQPLATVLGIKEGAQLTIGNAYNEETITREITGVSNVYIGHAIYYEKSNVNDFLGYPKEVYNAKWTNEEPTQEESILFIEDKRDMIENFESTSSLMRYSIFGISAFAFFIGVIVLTLITNLIVEENSPSISLFKVMGYTDKEISKLVVNIYTPLVVLAYIISVPIGVLAIDQMMASLVEQTGFSLPVKLTWPMIGIGFVIIMVTYYVSLFFSRKKVTKVSLQEALKKQQD
ncbi:FtsX-like permease family protein [Pontibacillus yanchengensis]|uniref:FtsX-like permease family protein n=1 Tax=Pontibacillus yanchengensis TaxID=462910 RepID=A0A6I4ZTR2_9BACI|nr:FtsX-like permease family protein [Pontibacillus yanchengensis]MYL33578.1 FtsX-like permease family protein [Pontibacillus yanchengensis]